MNGISHDAWWILLVDNDEEDYLITRSLLNQVQERQIRLDWAASCSAAEELLTRNLYTAVLVDYELGEQTGIDLIRRTVQRGYPAPLILYTGRASHEVDLEAMQAGATVYLTKPEVTPLLLERFIRYAVERRRVEEELDRRLQERSDILESITDGFFSIGRNWRIHYANQRVANVAGLKAETLIGMDFWETFPILLGTIYEKNYRQVMQSRMQMQFEAQGMVNPSIWYTINVYPSEDGISIYMQDNTRRRRSEEALKRSEAIYRAMARNFPNGGIIIVDHDLCCLIADGEVLPQIGMARESVEGKKPADLLVEPLRGSIEARFRRALNGESQAYESVYQGLVLWSQFVPLRDEEGRIMAGMAIVQDITVQRNAEMAVAYSETKYHMLFDSMQNAFALHEIVCDEDGKPVDYRFLEANPAFELQTGLKSSEIVGKLVSEVLPGLESAWVETYGRVALGGEPVQMESYAAPLNRYYSVFAFSPRKYQFATMFTDITHSKQIEANLQEYAARLQRSNQDLEDFAVIASHDLREPLRKVQAYADMLRNNLEKTGSDEKTGETLERMVKAVSRMQTMLDGLLAYSRISSAGKPFRQVTLSDVARGVIEDLELRLEQTGGAVELGSLPVIDADPVQMRQLFQNLLGNALKFHRQGVPPRVKVNARIPTPGTICLVVTDNGVGFPPEAAGQIFLPFHRLNARSVYEGSGMGLAICRKIVERHGGAISAEGRPGEGATFTITLPAKH